MGLRMSNIKVDIELGDDLAGCQIKVDGKVKQWHGLDRQEQIKVCNMLSQFYNLFAPCIKEVGEDGQD